MPDLVETHQVEAVEVSRATHAEITRILRELGRDSRFHPTDRGVLIDMTRIGLIVRPD